MMRGPGGVTYNTEVKAIAWALLCQGLIPRQVTERLNEGSAGLDYAVPVSQATIQDWATKWRKERGDPLTFGAAERAEDSIRIIRQQLLDSLKIQANLFTSEASRGSLLTQSQIKSGAEIGKTLDDLERRSDERAGRSTRSQQTHAGEARGDKPKAGGLMDQLISAEKQSLADKERRNQRDAERKPA